MTEDRHPFILPQVRDGMDRLHDVYLKVRDGEVTLYSPDRFWSITFTSDQGDVLAPAIQGASDRARNQVSR